ncbi:hypothetical protein [Lactobacillus helveticus]|uniref:hypothetical protein n=1 Tax=Lactobacillus helveticus TaxID=1587 RepID=UPI001FB172C4|nr:hypothetical protein [Lactobacillus helveticus]
MNKIDELIKHVKDADAIVVGAGSGMLRATGLAFWYEDSPLYMDNMKYFAKKYGFNGLFQGFYNRFESEEEHWAFLLELYKMMNEIPPQKPTYEYLKNLIGDKPVHYVTTNQDFQIDQKQINAFQDFIQKYEDKKLVVLELGIGPRNQVIKVPSMQLVAADRNSRYITINKGELNIPDIIADRSIGFSASIGDAFKEIMTGKSHGATTQGPTKPQSKPELTPEQKAEQAKVMQQFYPDYMVDSGIRPSSFPMYLTIDQKHPSYLHTVQYG